MKTYGFLTLAMAASFLLLFGLVSLLEVPLLTDPSPWLGRGTPGAAGVGFVLLVADVLLPVPASLVMLAHGALFGVVVGTLLSLIGGVGAAGFGFAVGRRSRVWLQWIVPEDERRRVESLLDRWGELAVTVSRPIPILAESVAILAGGTRLSWRRFLLASVAGCLPAALVYAVAGALAVTIDHVPLVFGLVLAISVFVHRFGRRLRRDPADVVMNERLEGVSR